jgi:hypothetical protein
MTATVGRNAHIEDGQLFINGEAGSLHDSNDFKRFAINSAAAAGTAIALALSGPVKVPSTNGKPTDDVVEPWEHYSACALRLIKAQTHEETVSVGSAMLAWCALAITVADILELPERFNDDFLIVRYLTDHGFALGRSVEQWNEYLRLLRKYERMPLAFRIDNEAPRPPAQIQIALPWPEQLGIDLGGPDKLLENLLSVASDIMIADSIDGDCLIFTGSVGRFYFISPRDDIETLACACESAAPKLGAGALAFKAGDNDYLIRVSRREPGRDGVNARIYGARSMTALDTIEDS